MPGVSKSIYNPNRSFWNVFFFFSTTTFPISTSSRNSLHSLGRNCFEKTYFACLKHLRDVSPAIFFSTFAIAVRLLVRISLETSSRRAEDFSWSEDSRGLVRGRRLLELDRWKKPWLFRVYRGIYYPVMWGLFQKPWHKDPVIKQPGVPSLKLT